MREMRSAMGRNRLYSNGVAIRVMLEYIDYWGDQRVGDDGMTPLLNSREEDEGSKQLVLYSATRSPHFRPPSHSRLLPSPSRATSNIRQPLLSVFAVSPVLSSRATTRHGIAKFNKRYNVMCDTNIEKCIITTSRCDRCRYCYKSKQYEMQIDSF